VRYAEFRDRFEDALQQVGLFNHDAHRVETIDLAATAQRWKVYIIRAAPRSAEPFQVSAEIGFEWTPVDAARAYTCEEDLLMQLIGRRRRPTRTECRWKRVDLSLRANLPYGSTTSIPEPHVFGAWSASIVENVHATLSDIKERHGRLAGCVIRVWCLTLLVSVLTRSVQLVCAAWQALWQSPFFLTHQHWHQYCQGTPWGPPPS
jgi:hypothetical protein